MKPLFKTATALMLLLVNLSAFAVSPAVLRVYRENGGLFGYRVVNQGQPFINDQGLEQVDMSCLNPGREKCKLNMISLPGDFSENFPGMTEADFEVIDGKVDNSITETDLSGKFVYNGLCLVAWAYHEDTGAVEYSIYNKEAAQKIGFSF